jgi:hypothetical protein
VIPRSIKNKTHKSCHSAAFRLDRGRPASYAGGRLAPLAGGLGVGADVLLLRRARHRQPGGLSGASGSLEEILEDLDTYYIHVLRLLESVKGDESKAVISAHLRDLRR